LSRLVVALQHGAAAEGHLPWQTDCLSVEFGPLKAQLAMMPPAKGRPWENQIGEEHSREMKFDPLCSTGQKKKNKQIKEKLFGSSIVFIYLFFNKGNWMMIIINR